jgi:hypothetical protein
MFRPLQDLTRVREMYLYPNGKEADCKSVAKALQVRPLRDTQGASSRQSIGETRLASA